MTFEGAKLILFLGDQIIVLRRDDKPDIPWPDRLDFPGGGREGLETAETCVLRETQEEIGLTLSPQDLTWRHQHNQSVFFAAHLPESTISQIVFGSEGQGWLMLTPDAYVSHPDAIPHFALMLQLYLDQRFG